MTTNNPHFRDLQDYPFERMRQLTQGIQPSTDYAAISLSLGEPKHAPPQFVIDALADKQSLAKFLATYPATRGSDELRGAISQWLVNRFQTEVDP